MIICSSIKVNCRGLLQVVKKCWFCCKTQVNKIYFNGPIAQYFYYVVL